MTPEQRARRMKLVWWIVVGSIAVLLTYEAIALATHDGWFGAFRLFSITQWSVQGNGGLGIGTWEREARIAFFIAFAGFFTWLAGHIAFGWTKGR